MDIFLKSYVPSAGRMGTGEELAKEGTRFCLLFVFQTRAYLRVVRMATDVVLVFDEAHLASFAVVKLIVRGYRLLFG
jgi:hypothetical protein